MGDKYDRTAKEKNQIGIYHIMLRGVLDKI